MAKKKGNKIVRLLLWLFLLLLLGAGVAAYFGYKMIYVPNVEMGERKSRIILIPTGSEFEDVVRILSDSGLLKDRASFERVAELKKYTEKVKPGRYRILARASNNELVNLLRSGLQEPVTVTFTNIRTREQLVSRVCKKLEADSVEMLSMLRDNRLIKEKFGLKEETILSLFIPNTYQFNWNTSAIQFMERMQSEYKKFWTEERKEQAKKVGLSQSQVATLASIVQAEQMRFAEERPIIAGLYLNRLRIGMPLQSDPSIIYALGDYTINRVLDKDKEVNSPYNTYQHTGLPPGPILVPEISSLDAVLNYEPSDYIYMCAKEDFSGKHNFAKTLAEHSRNAYRYRNALNKSKILR